jgi:mono/diheme cytochrome c family protein
VIYYKSLRIASSTHKQRHHTIEKGVNRMRRFALVLFLVLSLGLAACGGDAGPAGGGDPTAGEEVFNQAAAPACNTCHSLQPGEDLVGPSLAGIGNQAGTRVSGQSAEAYLRESVTDPDAHVVEGYNANIMPAVYASQLSDQQIQDLVAYMLTLQ